MPTAPWKGGAPTVLPLRRWPLAGLLRAAPPFPLGPPSPHPSLSRGPRGRRDAPGAWAVKGASLAPAPRQPLSSVARGWGGRVVLCGQDGSYSLRTWGSMFFKGHLLGGTY